MESEQERFTHTMDLLELEVAGLEQHEDLGMVDRVAKLVGEISGRIADADTKCEFLRMLIQRHRNRSRRCACTCRSSMLALYSCSPKCDYLVE